MTVGRVSLCEHQKDTKETAGGKPCDINFLFYFKIVSQQGETQRNPVGPKPTEPSRTEAPLIIAMSLLQDKAFRGWRGGEERREGKKKKGEEVGGQVEGR